MAQAKVAIITGASSGIGWELSKVLALEGYQLGLIARRKESLARLAEEVRASGGRAEYQTADVASRQELVDAIRKLTRDLGPADLLVANAGVGHETFVDPLNVEQIEEMIRVNYLGAIYAIEAVLPDMLQRGQGHIAGVSSLAAYKGFPGQQGYCASKAALKTFLEGLRIQLRHRGIAVTTICPGFVHTPMTAKHRFGMPFVMNADEAARRIARALRRRKKVFNFPWQTERLAKFTYWIPDWIIARTLRHTYR